MDWIFSLLLAMSVSNPPAPETRPAPEEKAEDQNNTEIIVIAERAKEKKREVRLGSRIARPALFSGYRFIRSNTSMGGLGPGSGMDPGVHFVKGDKVTSCKSDDAELSAETACMLIAARAAMDKQDWPAAHAALDRLESAESESATALYRAAQTRYQIAQAQEDDFGRYFALEAMIDSGKLSDADTLAALRTRVAIALADDDNAAAIKELERVVKRAPQDSRSFANLAGLYQQAGKMELAGDAIRRAIAIHRDDGVEIPANWERLAEAGRGQCSTASRSCEPPRIDGQ